MNIPQLPLITVMHKIVLLLLFISCADAHSSHNEIDNGVLLRVSEYLETVMTVPVKAIDMMKKHHKYDGFRPHGMHAAGRDRVLSYLYSVVKAFNDITLYFGTEQGEYFSYFDTELVYREPGNSGYDPSDPDLSMYYNVCTNGADGSLMNCTMNPGDQYVQCINDCELVECNKIGSQTDCEGFPSSSLERLECEQKAESAWCTNYVIETVQDGETLGYVPASYHCMDRLGLPSQEPGGVLYLSADETFIGDGGSCTYDDDTPVNRVHSGPFASCGGEVCSNTYVGVLRTVEYDPRRRPWYISTKANQQATWFSPYSFHTYAGVKEKIGISYTEPYYSYNEDGKNVFEGVIAVDYTLDEISVFLEKNYGDQDDAVVMVFEATAPHYLIGISTGTFPYRGVLTSDEAQPCVEDSEECTTVRVKATDIIGQTSQNPFLDRIASNAVKASVSAGFPFGEAITVSSANEQEHSDGSFSKSYYSLSTPYQQPGTSLDWILMSVSPMTRSPYDTIMPGDPLFVVVIVAASLGVIGCCTLLALWWYKKHSRFIRHGDFFFTSCFIAGCILLNLSSFASLGENTDTMCTVRTWTMNVSFVLAFAPLLVKILRIYLLIGLPGRTMRRKKISNKLGVLWCIPIIAVELCILTVFSLLDPHKATEQFFFDTVPPVHQIECRRESAAYDITQLVFYGILLFLGCLLSYLSRNVNAAFGEAKQLFFGMYNIAFTGVGFILLTALVEDVSKEAIHSFRTILIVWGTVLTCAVFVLPRFFQAKRPDRESSQSSHFIRVSGFNQDSAPFREVDSIQFSDKVGEPSSKNVKISCHQEHVVGDI